MLLSRFALYLLVYIFINNLFARFIFINFVPDFI
jgi:hypothetical protein